MLTGTIRAPTAGDEAAAPLDALPWVLLVDTVPAARRGVAGSETGKSGAWMTDDAQADVYAGGAAGEGGTDGAHRVLFVCPHGAGKSRMAAAFFNAAPAPGWTGTTAGIHPGEAVSPVAVRLLAGSAEEATLDLEAPRPLGSIPRVDLVVSIDCDALAEIPAPGSGTRHVRWDLTASAMDEEMRDELRERVVVLVESLRGSGTYRG